MLKIRITFVNDLEGEKELDNALINIKKNFEVINKSKVYKGRGASNYSNIYIDVRGK